MSASSESGRRSGHRWMSRKCPQGDILITAYGSQQTRGNMFDWINSATVEHGDFLPCCLVSSPPRTPTDRRRLNARFNLLDRFGHRGGVVMDNEPPPVTPFVYKGIPRLHRFGGAWRLTREEERVGSDIGGYVAPDPDCTGIDDAA